MRAWAWGRRLDDLMVVVRRPREPLLTRSSLASAGIHSEASAGKAAAPVVCGRGSCAGAATAGCDAQPPAPNTATAATKTQHPFVIIGIPPSSVVDASL